MKTLIARKAVTIAASVALTWTLFHCSWEIERTEKEVVSYEPLRWETHVKRLTLQSEIWDPPHGGRLMVNPLIFQWLAIGLAWAALMWVCRPQSSLIIDPIPPGLHQPSSSPPVLYQGAPPTATTQPSCLTNEPSVSYAGFWRRASAVLVDCLVFLFPVTILNVLIAVSVYGPDDNPSYPRSRVLIEILTAIEVWSYFSLMESSRFQGTVGKLVLRIKVTDMEGRQVSFSRALGRQLAKIASGATLWIGFVMAAFTARKQALHDMMAECLVVRR